ncbi:tyrosinase family protein [Aspergillus stella-maris]|uniref:tyrosinase family protein n=1 Tax=Aspergillus stella-maris TaxID=1810926 RepID=UPI003CCCB852
MTEVEKSAFIDAELCLMSSPTKLNIEGALNRWDELVYVHIAQSNFIHSVGAFLPWHRMFMRAHEYILQTECNYTGGHPYWHESLDVDALNASSVFDPDTGFGGEGGDCVNDGPFKHLRLHINQTSTQDDSCLHRSLDPESFLLAGDEYVNACMETDNYEDAWNCFIENPHVAGHFGVGGTMRDVVASPGDPLFFLHHTNLDRLWWEWQSANLSSRLYAISGTNIPDQTYLDENDFEFPSAALRDYDGDAGNVTTLNHVLWMGGVVPNATVGEVMDLHGERNCAEYVY